MALHTGKSYLLARNLRHITRASQHCVAALHTEYQLHDKLVSSRRTFERLVPEQRFSIAGVTFEGRQELVCGLQQRQPLLLVKEPGNPHDPHAVSVQNLTGQSLGFVPREDNQQFTLGLQLGRVASAGQVPDGPWGASVYTQAGLISLTADPLPPARRQAALSQFVARVSAQNRLVQQALVVAQGSCEVTGVAGGSAGGSSSAGDQLVPMPIWTWDAYNKVVRLATLAMVHPAIMAAKTELNTAVSSASTGLQSEKAWAHLVRDINDWTPEQLADHIGWASALEQRMEEDGWEVKVDM